MSKPNEMRDWSFDLETLDTKYSSAILSIGMVQFNRDTGKQGVKHYVEITMDSAIKCGTVSGSTLSWWMRQGDKAKRVFREEGKTPLSCALADIATIIRSKGGAPRVWGNGSSFDITILEHAFITGAHGLAIPWQFRDIRDMRTIVDEARIDTRSLARVGTHHNALDDAVFQATAISLAHRKIQAALGVDMPPWEGEPGVITGSPAVTEPPVTVDEDDEL